MSLVSPVSPVSPVVFMTPTWSTVWLTLTLAEIWGSGLGWRLTPRQSGSASVVGLASLRPLQCCSNSLVRDAGLEWYHRHQHTQDTAQVTSCPLPPVTVSQCHNPIYSYCSPLDVWTQCWDQRQSWRYLVIDLSESPPVSLCFHSIIISSWYPLYPFHFLKCYIITFYSWTLSEKLLIISLQPRLG